MGEIFNDPFSRGVLRYFVIITVCNVFVVTLTIEHNVNDGNMING